MTAEILQAAVARVSVRIKESVSKEPRLLETHATKTSSAQAQMVTAKMANV